jgi:hypothetical protein
MRFQLGNGLGDIGRGFVQQLSGGRETAGLRDQAEGPHILKSVHPSSESRSSENVT